MLVIHIAVNLQALELNRIDVFMVIINAYVKVGPLDNFAGFHFHFYV